MNFKELNLSPATQKAIASMKFTKMTPIQEQAIPLLLAGKDLIGQAETGTGKTAAFAIPSIERLDLEAHEIQILVLCPTRELCCQVAEQFKTLMQFEPKFKCLPIYGGQKINIQLQGIKEKPQIIIGTPGRVIDHIQRGSLRLRMVQTVILDEADQMLSMGFRNDIEMILGATRNRKQTVLFSATMQTDVLELARKHQKKAQHINIKKSETKKPQIKQVYYKAEAKEKAAAIRQILFTNQIKSALIFCNTKFQVDRLCTSFQEAGYSAAKIHGDLKQSRRDSVMRKYREGEHRILIATDIAARGIDVDDIEAVFNFNLPRDSQDYVHRIGRTGRAGKTGLAINLVDSKEVGALRHLAKKHNFVIPEEALPLLSDLQFSSILSLENHLMDSTLCKKTAKRELKRLRKLLEDTGDEAKAIKIYLKDPLKNKDS